MEGLAWVGRVRCGAPPLPGSSGKAEPPEVASKSRHSGLALPTPGLPIVFSEPSLKTTGKLALPVREQEWQQVKASPYGLGIPIPFLLPTKG